MPHALSPITVALRIRRFGLVAVAAFILTLAVAGSAEARSANSSSTKPTIVLVHGAFADASSWNGVSQRLRQAGHPVLAPALPLRGVASDSAYIASVVATLKGPVVLVGHSYAGAIIGQAAASLPSVKALVYVDGLALDVGESAQAVGAKYTNNLLGPALITRPFPLADGRTGKDLYVDPKRFPAVFGADLPRRITETLAVAQRPIADTAFTDNVTAAAWKTIPSSFVFGRHDRAIDPAELAFLARRAGGPMTVLNGSHLSLISHAPAVARVIRRAAAKAG